MERQRTNWGDKLGGNCSNLGKDLKRDIFGSME
jgi:hypothetical protein